MPIYDYRCSSCNTRTEVIHGIDAPGPRFCPTCGAEDTLRKAFAPPAVHFKGTGWAKKDRSSSTTKARAKSDAGDGTGTKAGTTGDGTGSTNGSGPSSGSNGASPTGTASSTGSSASAGD